MPGAPKALSETPKHALLGDVLRKVRINGALFVRGEFSAPWAFASGSETALASILAPDANRLVLMHLAIEGSFRVALEDDAEESDGVLVSRGEAVVLPYCDRHAVGFPSTNGARPVKELLPKPPWKELPVACRMEGGGARARILCGYLHCDATLFDPLLRALPRLIHVRAESGPAAAWREASMRYVAEQLSSGAKNELSSRIPELVLVDCLHQYAATLAPSQGGFLASLDDPVVGGALRLMHGAPTEDWTVERLAKEIGVSRSILADRFTLAIGQPPIRYLAQWRLQLAADLVRTTTLGLAEIAARVGYDSEHAFSRAFKRQFGRPPGSFRE